MNIKEWVAFALMGLIWGAAYVWVKVGLDELEPITLVAFRLLLSVLGLAVIMRWRHIHLPHNLHIWYALGLMGLTQSVVPLLLVTWGQQYVASSVASLLGATIPLFTMVFAHFIFDDERFTYHKAMSLIVGFLGVVILAGRNAGNENFESNVIGQVAILAASVFHAGSAVYSRRNLRHVSPYVQTFGVTLMATISIWIWLPFTTEWPVTIPTQTISWAALLWLGLLGSGGGYLIYYWMIQTSGATTVSLITYIIPPISIILGVIFLHERVDWQLVASVLLIGMSIIIFKSEGRRPTMRLRLKTKSRLS